MRNTIFIICFFLSTISVLAQAPTQFNYQAVARDASDQPYRNTNLGIRISLIKGGSSGIVSYSERHLVTTSQLGVLNIKIGDGTVLAGNLGDIDWGDDSYYIKVDMDPDGGTDYIYMGVNQLLSVPYALYAKKSGDGSGDDADADPTNELQTLSFDPDNNTLSLSDGNTVTIPSGGTDADADPTNELQTLSFDPDNNTLSLSDGNTITIPSGGTDADADPSNEIQTITLTGNQIILSNGGGVINLPTGTTDTDDQTLMLNGTNLSIADGNTVDLSSVQDGVDDADNNPNNELQTLSKSGNTVTLSDSGGSFTDAVDDADADASNELQTLSFDINNNTLSLSNGNTVIIPNGGTDADADPTNEIQMISLNGTQILLSNGGGVINLPTGTTDTDDQTLMLNGTNLSIADGNTVDLSSVQDGVDDADNNPNNELQTLSKSGNTVTLSDSGGSFTDAVDDADADASNELQTISLNGNQILLSNGGGVINLPTGTTDTDDQTLMLNGTNLSIADGNTVDLSSVQDGVDDADNNPNNELQTLSKSGNTVTLSDSGGSFTDAVDDADADAGNELQTINKSGNIVTLSNNGGNFTDATQDADADPENEIQSLNLVDNQLSISGSNMVNLNSIASPWTVSGDNISYTTGITHVNSLTTNNLDIYGLDEHTSLTASGVEVANGFANNSSSLESSQLELSNGLSVSRLEAGLLHMTGAETSNLTDSQLGFENTSGLMTTLGANELVFKDTPNNYKVRITGSSDGKIRLYNTDYNETVVINSSSYKTGQITLKDGAGNTSILLTHLSTGLSHGYLAIKADGDEKAVMYATGDKAGLMRLRGTNATTNVVLSSANNNNGTMALYDNGDRRQVYIRATQGSAGYIDITASNIGGNSRNAQITWLSGYVGHGYSSVNDWSGNAQAGMYVNAAGNGVVFADVKNFRMDHPTEAGKEIWYASLEGPEAGAYERGTAIIENGEAFVQFSDHFKLVGNHETMTVSLTPLSADTYGLAVVEKLANGFKVKELAGGSGNFSFDWEVKCVRKGYEDYRVIRDEKEVRPGE